MTASDRVLRAGVVLAVAAVAVQTAAHVFNLFVLGDRYSGLDVSGEHTAFAWASAAATFGAGCAAILLAPRLQTRGRRLMVLLGALLAYLSLDDSVEIHEKLGTWTEDALGLPEAVGPRIWLLVYLPVLAAAALLLVWSARNAPERAGRYQAVGIALLIAATLSEGLGVFTKLLEEHGFESPHRLRAALEEGLELAGWIIVAAGIAAVLYADEFSGTRRSPDPRTHRRPWPRIASRSHRPVA